MTSIPFSWPKYGLVCSSIFSDGINNSIHTYSLKIDKQTIVKWKSNINDCIVVQNRILYVGIISPCLVYSICVILILWACYEKNKVLKQKQPPPDTVLVTWLFWYYPPSQNDCHCLVVCTIHIIYFNYIYY
jgi:hypothetical protein